MKSRESGILFKVLVFFFLLSPLKLQGEEGAAQAQAVTGSLVTFKATNPELLTSFLTPENTKIANEMIRNLVFFEKETEETQFLQDAQFEFVFENRDPSLSFNQCKINASHTPLPGESPYTKTYMIEQFTPGQTGISALTVIPIKGIPLLENIYRIVNVSYDPDGRFAVRVILKTTRDPSFNCDEIFSKFQEGKWIEYKNYAPNHLPQILTNKTFILAKDGSKIWLKIKSHNRTYSEKGLIVQETSQETTYAYSGLDAGQTYAVYNVGLDQKGEINAYTIIFPKLADVPFSEEENLEINLERNETGVLLKKMIRKFKIADNAKSYDHGILQEFTLDETSRVIKSVESGFDIPAGKIGLTPDERILKDEVLIWNLTFDDKGQALSKRVLHCTHESTDSNGGQKDLKLFQSLKSVVIERDPEKGSTRNLEVNYFDYSIDRKLIVKRRIKIEIMETLFTGDPTKIKLVIESPTDPSLHDEEILIQDCNYIINEAVSGELFTQKNQRTFDIDLVEISDQGDILRFEFYDFVMENGVRKYVTKTVISDKL